MGIHPNTVRLYEELQLVPRAQRLENGYRVFSEWHVEQFKIARIALKVEILQNGLRKKIIHIIKLSAQGQFQEAISCTNDYINQVRLERKNAEEALEISNRLFEEIEDEESDIFLTIKQTSEYLQGTIDTLRNWELNGLFSIKRKQNGYRMYTESDIRRLKIIRTSRCANYSLSSILRLRMFDANLENKKVDIREVIDSPGEHEDIVTACDKLLTSLNNAEKNAEIILEHLKVMKEKYMNFTL